HAPVDVPVDGGRDGEGDDRHDESDRGRGLRVARPREEKVPEGVNEGGGERQREGRQGHPPTIIRRAPCPSSQSSSISTGRSRTTSRSCARSTASSLQSTGGPCRRRSTSTSSRGSPIRRSCGPGSAGTIP